MASTTFQQLVTTSHNISPLVTTSHLDPTSHHAASREFLHHHHRHQTERPQTGAHHHLGLGIALVGRPARIMQILSLVYCFPFETFAPGLPGPTCIDLWGQKITKNWQRLVSLTFCVEHFGIFLPLLSVTCRLTGAVVVFAALPASRGAAGHKRPRAIHGGRWGTAFCSSWLGILGIAPQCSQP